MILILFRGWILINFVAYLRVNLLSDPLKVIHRNQTEQSILPRHGLLLSGRCIDGDCVFGRASPLLVLLIIWVDHEGSCKVARCKIVIPACCSCLAARSCHAIDCTGLFISLVSHHLLFCLVRGYPLLGNHGIVRVIQMVQFIRDPTVLCQSQGIIIYSLELLFKVLMGHYIVVSAQRLDYLLPILIYRNGL